MPSSFTSSHKSLFHTYPCPLWRPPRFCSKLLKKVFQSSVGSQKDSKKNLLRCQAFFTLKAMLIFSSHNLEPLSQTSSLFILLKREWAVTWALCKNNFPGNLAGFLGGFIPRLLVLPVLFATASTAFLRVVITCLIWVYMFDIANTTSSVEEDKLNKPHRPIPAGLITVKQARVRWLISWCLALSILGLLYGKWPAFYMALMQTWVFGFYVWPAYRHWLTKSIMVTGGTFMMLRLLNAVILDIDQWRMNPEPDMIVCVWTMATIHLQDFRDIEGDRTTHAVTIPIILSPKGQTALRHTTACVLITGNIISISWIWMQAQCAYAFLTGLLFNMSASILAFYTVTSTPRYQDRIMYRWWMATGFCVINHVYYLYLLQKKSRDYKERV